MSALRLTVAIATLADRLDRLDLKRLPPIKGVYYHVFIQGSGLAVPAVHVPARSDMTLTPLQSIGVAKSRNAAIAMAQGDILLFADDDLALNTASYPRLLDHFATHPKLGFVCAQLRTEQGLPFKSYTSNGSRASRFNTAKVGTPELAIRLQTLRAAGVLFDPEFGAGSPNWLGDEYIFLCDALRAGVRGQHIDLVFATHSTPSSGHSTSAESFKIRDAVLRRALGPLSWPLRCGFAWRHRHRFPSWGSLLQFIKL